MKEKILIVDDDKDTCDALEEILADEDYQTICALSGQSALNTIKKEKPDLVLLDIMMPEMDGIKVLKRMKKIDKDLVVIMITGYDALDTAKEAMRLGAYDYITKPGGMHLIKAIVNDALSEKTKK